MKNYQKIILTALVFFGVYGVASAAPGWIYQRTILPETDQAFDLGTTSLQWRKIYTKDLTVTGTCTGCGSSASYPFTPTTNYNVAVNSTSTPIWFTAGLMASSTSYFVYASTTALTVSGNAYFPGSGIWNSSGNVGIGTTSPTWDLSVVGGIAAYPTSNSASSIIGAVSTDYDSSFQSAFLRYRDSGVTANRIDNIPNADLAELAFQNATNALISTNGPTPIILATFAHEAVRIQGGSSNQGFVGIASTSPFARLSVHGNANDTAIAKMLFAVGSSTASATTTLFTISNTGTAYFASQVGVGTSTPSSKFKAVVDGTAWITSLGAGNTNTIIGTGYSGPSAGVPNIGDMLNVGSSTTYVPTGGTRAGVFNVFYNGPASSGAAAAQGINGNAGMGTGATGNLTGTTFGGPIRNRNQVFNNSTGYNLAMSSAFSGLCLVQGTLASTTNCASFHAELPTIDAGNLITNNYGLWVRGGTPSGTLTNRYGVYIDDLVGGTNRYGFYQAGSSDLNYFNGNTGIGSSSPFAKLSVHGNANDATINTTLFAIASSTATATTTHFTVKNDGKVYAPNTTSSGSAQTGYWCYDADGQFVRTSTTCLVSASRFKEHVGDLDVGLAELMKLRPVSYFLKDTMGDPNNADQQIGFIAEEAQAVDARLVTRNSEGQVQSFRYEQFTALLTKAIQEQQRQIENLKVGVVEIKRSVEEDWQNFFLLLLFAGLIFQQVQINKLRK